MDTAILISSILKLQAEKIMDAYKGKSREEKEDFYSGVWSVFALSSYHLINAGVGDPVPTILEGVLKEFDEFRESE